MGRSGQGGNETMNFQCGSCQWAGPEHELVAATYFDRECPECGSSDLQQIESVLV